MHVYEKSMADKEEKSAIQYSFWVRPTQNWTCSHDDYKRAFDSLDFVTSQYEEPLPKRAYNWFYVFSIINLVINAFMFIKSALAKCRKNTFKRDHIFYRVLILFPLVFTLSNYVIYSQNGFKS